jgi:hypothetical protein
MANDLQRIFAAVNGDCFYGQFFQRFDDSIRVVTLVIDNQNYAFVCFQSDTSP